MNTHFIYGVHTVKSLLDRNPDAIQRLYCLPGATNIVSELVQTAKQLGVVVEKADKERLQKLLGEVTHQGVAACVKTQPLLDFKQALSQLPKDPLVLVLDHLQDPRNLGAVLRTAAAVGVDLVVMPKAGAAPLSQVARKAACGAAELLAITEVSNINRALETLKEQGLWIYGLSLSAEQSLYQTKLSGAICLVMGEEGRGLRRLTEENCDFLVKIPMSEQMQSLNVSAATAVTLFEIYRQKTMC